MNRFRLTGILTGLLLFFHVFPLPAQEFRSTPFPDRITLTWSADPATTQTVTWRTAAGITGAKAQIKQEDASPDMETGMREFTAESRPFVGKEGYEDRYHHVTFTDLRPSTAYTYRVGDGERWSEWFQFRTADAAGNAADFSFIYLGDGQNDLKSRWSRTIRQAFRQQPDARFIIHAGDLINRSNTDAEWGEWHHGAGFIHAMVPAIPTPGNHEYFRDDKERPVLDPHWAVQFVLPKNGPEGLQESVYYLDYQHVRIIALNSQLIMLDEAARNAQLQWLEEVLKSSPKQWTIVTMHHPVYSTSKRRDNVPLRELFKPLFDRYGVDLVLQGHDHTYARGRGPEAKPGGPMYVLSVAGPKMYESDADRWMDVSLENTQLYQTVRISGNRLEFKSYDVSGRSVDAFTLTK
ncbi:Calcineurin-like phosphoesterase [Parapedobacter composti]|uniref:Calcineurin-like phosphoesterase n=1 Tax=Parapedobacter composti TaxID=623281 RepID=A0A1I1L5J8_9SPHI|nr:metallophosphoesterase family protein [Parapedobacter composti]SFC68281.1 Calcineurin-like phosphoesterase [Parapedobacter composti]